MKTSSIVVVGILVLAFGTFSAVQAGGSKACASKSKTAAAGSDCVKSATQKASCAACDHATTVATANAHECCKAAVAAVKASCKAACTTASAKAGYNCEKTAAKSAGAGQCSKSAAVKTASLTGCCKATVSKFEEARAAYWQANTASYSCSKSAGVKSAGSAGCDKSAAKTAGGSSCSKDASSAGTFASIPHREGKRMVLTGNLACGHCDFKTTEACQAAFRTADGKAFLLRENHRVKKMRSEKAKNGYKIVTRVRKLDGVKYLEVEKFSAL